MTSDLRTSDSNPSRAAYSSDRPRQRGRPLPRRSHRRTPNNASTGSVRCRRAGRRPGQDGSPVITAVNGICCGGGFHWIADADIVIAGKRRAVLRSARVGGPGGVDRGDRAHREDPGRGGDADGVRRSLRAHRQGSTCQYEFGMISEIVDPAERLHDRGPGAGRAIARNSPATMAATKKALWGPASSSVTDHVTNSAHAAHAEHVGSPRPAGGSGHVRREAGPRTGR